MRHAQQLGRYLLLDRIAFGGMAEIYRAKTFDAQGRTHMVAVKKVLNHLTHDEDFLRMLVDEAKISAILQHANIARVYEFVHSGDDYYIAMEYVDGKDARGLLERHRQRKQPIPPEHVAWVIMEAARALDAAHKQRDSLGRELQIVHRDVSPSNLLLSYSGEVKLCDFGIAKATLTRVQTKTGVIKGKVKYMSPEQAMGRRLDHRSDLFSLGTVMYEMLTLEAPFQAPTEVELIFAVRDAKKRDPRETAPEIPHEVVQILDKLMARSRSERYQSGEALAVELEQFLEAFRPGYRRSHFARFMRSIFAPDIERELRQLEDWVLDPGNPQEVGENLIKDVLPSDAPYTQFTAARMGKVGDSRVLTSHFPRLEPKELPDLHGQPTQILDRMRPASEQPLHQQKTMILSRKSLEMQAVGREKQAGERPVTASGSIETIAKDAHPSVDLDEADTGPFRKTRPPSTGDTDEMSAAPPADESADRTEITAAEALAKPDTNPTELPELRTNLHAVPLLPPEDDEPAPLPPPPDADSGSLAIEDDDLEPA
jgi:serine/threonine-protein kinase